MIEGDRLYKRVTDNATRDPTLQLIVGGGLEQAIYNNVLDSDVLRKRECSLGSFRYGLARAARGKLRLRS